MIGTVIARHAEDLGWITRIPGDFAVRIVSKGAKITAGRVLDRAVIVTDRPR